MDIIVEQVPDIDHVSEKLDSPSAIGQQEPPANPPASPSAGPPAGPSGIGQEEQPQQKRRGRPPGSKNKVKIIEQELIEPIVPLRGPPAGLPAGPSGSGAGNAVIDPIPPASEPIPEQPKLKRSSPRKQAPRRAPPASPSGPQSQPVPPGPAGEDQRQLTSLDIAANMLNMLRIEQAERQQRKAELYRSWVK